MATITKNNMHLKSKLPDIGTSIFTVMSKMALDYNAINLAQGFPDFNCSDELIELVNHYQQKGFNQYAPMAGVPSLREQISFKMQKLYNRLYNKESEITVTAGATQAIYTAITTVVKPGDEVIILEPAYDLYVPGVKASGGIPVYVKLIPPDYSYDWDAIRKCITDKTTAIILNSPHNPTGSLITKNDISQLEELTLQTDIKIISDEVYEHIVFDGYEHISLASSDKLAERSFVISSFGKTFHATGWKMGYCAAPDYLMKEFRKMHQFIVFSANTPIQYAYADYLKDENHYLHLNEFYQNKRDIFRNKIAGSKFKLMPCKGTYFQLFGYDGVSELNDKEFAEYLTKEKSIAVIPLSPFYNKGSSEYIIRVCFAKNDAVLINAAETLAKI
jgi:methionine aminotransferase